MAEERFKRNMLLGALSAAGTVAFLTWGVLLSGRKPEPEYTLSPEAPSAPNQAMLSAAANLGHGPRVMRASPLPVDTPNHSVAASARAPAAAAGPRLRRVGMPDIPRSSPGWSAGEAAGSGASGSGGGASGAAGGSGSLGDSKWDLTPEDAAALMKKAGPMDAASAGRMGSNPRQLMETANELLDHPRAVHWLMDNPNVAKKYFEQPKVKDACANSRALARELSAEADSTGLRSYLKTLARSMGVPGSTVALVESRINAVLFSKCPSFQQLGSDPVLVSTLMNTAPEFFKVMGDPRFASALVTQPTR